MGPLLEALGERVSRPRDEHSPGCWDRGLFPGHLRLAGGPSERTLGRHAAVLEGPVQWGGTTAAPEGEPSFTVCHSWAPAPAWGSFHLGTHGSACILITHVL